MGRLSVKVALLEFEEGGTTLWVHDSKGSTVLRLKAKKINVQRECGNICAHVDVIVPEEITVCVPTSRGYSSKKPPTKPSPLKRKS